MTLIDPVRLKRTFEAYSQIGRTENGGLHRLALTDVDAEARDTLVTDLEELGLDVRIDELGNIFGRRHGTRGDASAVLIGSHLDSQPCGGRYDGQLGVLAALETLRTFEDEGIETQRPVELVNWTNEEGSRFKPALLGSGAFTGQFDTEDVLSNTDENEISVRTALREIGYDGDESAEPKDDIHSYLELHVEQGPILEQNEVTVGIVDGVFGMSWLEASIYGEADHAGPSPTHSRTDALVATADVITAVRRLSNRLSEDAVTTVGELAAKPNSINVIPDTATFTIDIRSYDDSTVAEGIGKIEAELEAACDREGAEFDLEELWRIPHTEFSPSVRNTIDEAAMEADCSYQRIIGGAGHDANYLNDITDTGLLFAPSVGGKTHNESEFTEWEDVITSADVFARATQKLANE